MRSCRSGDVCRFGVLSLFTVYGGLFLSRELRCASWVPPSLTAQGVREIGRTPLRASAPRSSRPAFDIDHDVITLPLRVPSAWPVWEWFGANRLVVWPRCGRPLPPPPPLRSRTWRWWRTCTYTLSQSRLFTWPVFAWGSCTPAIPPPGVAWHAAWVSALWFRPTHNTFGFCTFLFILICFLHLPHFQVCFCSPILTYRSAHLIHITPITLHIPSFSSIFHTCWHIGLTFLHHIFYHFFIISLTHTLPVFTHLHHLTSHTFSFLLSDVLICSYFQASTYIHGDNLRHHTTTPSCPCTVTPPQLPWCGLCLQFTCLARPLSLPLPGLVSVFG